MLNLSVFEIATFIYTLVGLSLALWGVSILRKRTSGKFPITRQDIERLRKEAKSPWDPFGVVGSKRWRLIIILMFCGLVIINFAGW